MNSGLNFMQRQLFSVWRCRRDPESGDWLLESDQGLVHGSLASTTAVSCSACWDRRLTLFHGMQGWSR